MNKELIDKHRLMPVVVNGESVIVPINPSPTEPALTMVEKTMHAMADRIEQADKDIADLKHDNAKLVATNATLATDIAELVGALEIIAAQDSGAAVSLSLADGMAAIAILTLAKHKWQPIETALKDGTKITVKTAGGHVLRVAWYNGLENSEGADCGGWHSLDEGDDIPPSWTDGICWESNEDEMPSDPPILWKPL